MKLPELATLGSLLIGLQGCGTAPPLVQRHFESLEATRLVGPRAAIGELREVHGAGYTNLFGMAGSHSFFHTTHDSLATTRPQLLEPVAQAFADALTEVAQRAAR